MKSGLTLPDTLLPVGRSMFFRVDDGYSCFEKKE
jgi:hypothetical protein